MKIKKIAITPRRRANLTKLADYLESLPEDYAHFDMSSYQEHNGSCDLSSTLDPAIVKAIEEHLDTIGADDDDRREFFRDNVYAASVGTFLGNCGTVACALGHGPAAGIPLAKAHIETEKVAGVDIVKLIAFSSYAKLFVHDISGYDSDWDWLFGADWEGVDNHHWGAAARIRFYLDHGGYPTRRNVSGDEVMVVVDIDAVELYHDYRVDRRQAAPAD